MLGENIRKRITFKYFVHLRKLAGLTKMKIKVSIGLQKNKDNSFKKMLEPNLKNTA